MAPPACTAVLQVRRDAPAHPEPSAVLTDVDVLGERLSVGLRRQHRRSGAASARVQDATARATAVPVPEKAVSVPRTGDAVELGPFHAAS